jgi:hypothetical protein
LYPSVKIRTAVTVNCPCMGHRCRLDHHHLPALVPVAASATFTRSPSVDLRSRRHRRHSRQRLPSLQAVCRRYFRVAVHYRLSVHTPSPVLPYRTPQSPWLLPHPTSATGYRGANTAANDLQILTNCCYIFTVIRHLRTCSSNSCLIHSVAVYRCPDFLFRSPDFSVATPNSPESDP